MTQSEHLPSSMMTVEIGGRQYPMVSIAQCHTCQHPMRMWIEGQLVEHGNYSQISRRLPDIEGVARPSASAISRHFENGHMPIKAEARHQIIARRAAQQGQSLMDGTAKLVDGVVAAEMILQQGVERIASGELQVDVADTISAARFLQSVDRETDSGLDQEAWVTAMTLMLSEFEALMGTQMFNQFGKRVSSNGILKTLVQRQQAAAIEEAVNL